jgi:ATP-binding cassette subfamily C (CFTR/MRP) protein 10
MFSFRRENRRYVELSQRAQFAGIAASQWLSLRLQMIGVVMVAGVAVIAIIEHAHQAVNASE